MLSVGQLISVAPTKWVLIGLIFIFELGNLLCGAASSMKVLIFGRAVAGVGGGGISICVFTIFAEILPLEKRPLLFGAFGVLFALSSVVGPILGGVFADHVSWRWCFYSECFCLAGFHLIEVEAHIYDSQHAYRRGGCGLHRVVP
jgi:MFS family permease